MNRELSRTQIRQIKDLAAEKLGLCRKGNDVIGLQIFSILQQFARVIYYPLGADGPWGFTRMAGEQNTETGSSVFVVINSSIAMDCQVFAAAHELYHIWYENTPDLIPSDLLNDQTTEINEKKANRFAAEFLVDEQLLKQEIDLQNIQDFSIKNVLRLANLFTVPYRTMAKRLFEIGKINNAQMKRLLAEDNDAIKKWKKIYSIPTLIADEYIAIDNLVELAVQAYEKQYITYEKLEYLLDLSDLNPAELGIEQDAYFTALSDEELEKLLEE